MTYPISAEQYHRCLNQVQLWLALALDCDHYDRQGCLDTAMDWACCATGATIYTEEV